MFSTLLIPWLLTHKGPHVAFAIPGVLMFVATLCFWLGRHKFVHIPPAGWGAVREALSPEGLSALARLRTVRVRGDLLVALRSDQLGLDSAGGENGFEHLWVHVQGRRKPTRSIRF